MTSQRHWGLDFVTLELICSAAETGSISNAARAQNLAVAAASRRISDFENRIGIQLFSREARGVTLTGSGQAALSSIRLLLADANGLARAIEGAKMGVTEHLRLLANNAAITSVLAVPLARYSKSFPQVRIEVEESATRDTVRAVLERRANLGVVWTAVDSSGLPNSPLGSDALVLIVPISHPLARYKAVPFDRALDHDFVLFETTSPIYLLLGVEAGRSGRTLRGRVTVRGFYAMSRMVEAGLGVGVVPRQIGMQMARAMSLKVLPMSEAWARMDFSVVFRDRAQLSASERDFVEECARCAAIKQTRGIQPSVKRPHPDFVNAR